MKARLFILFILFPFTQSFSQSAIAAVAPIDYDVVSTRPEFPGGTEAFMKYIVKNFKAPDVETDLSGNVVVRMVINTEGTVSDVKIVKDLGEGTGKEVKRVLLASPKWKPGQHNGVLMNVVYEFPIKIRL